MATHVAAGQDDITQSCRLAATVSMSNRRYGRMVSAPRWRRERGQRRGAARARRRQWNRLSEDKFWRLVRRLHEEKRLPVYVLVDNQKKSWQEEIKQMLSSGLPDQDLPAEEAQREGLVGLAGGLLALSASR